jgi:hypothetical protein
MAPNSNNERLIAITKALLRRTRDGAIEWEIRSYGSRDGSEQVDYSTSANTITVKPRDDDGQKPYVLIVKNSSGIEIDRLDPGEWPDDSSDGALDELYTVARRQALDVDRTLDQLLNDLGGDLDE